MRRVLLFIFIGFFGFNSFGQMSNLTIFSEEGTSFYLILNGVRQNANPQTNIRVNGLINENYTAKIVFSNQEIPSIEKNYLRVVDMDGQRGEVTYKIKRNRKGKLKLRYYSFTPALQVLPPPASVQIIEYNTTPMPEINYTETVTTTTTTTGGSNENVGVQINMGGFGIDANININDSGMGSTTTTTTTTTTTSSGVVVVNQDDMYVEEVGCYPMDSQNFSGALSSIERKSFSDTQLRLAKQIVSSNCLTANQIKRIAKIFSFEETKLELAKYAYGYCYDPENYWQINDIFSFESTTDELDEFIRNGR